MYGRLKNFRESLGLTQAEFGRSIGIAKSTYNNYETGIRDPKSDFWIAIAQKYNVTIDYLMGFRDTPYPFDGDSKKALPISEEAMKLAKDYDGLDHWGQKQVRSVADIEAARMADESRRATGEAVEEAEDNVAYFPLRCSTQSASAGTGTYLGPEAFETIHVRDNELTRRASFSVPVSGDSMEPRYHDKDILMVEGTERIEPGEIGIFTIDGEGYVKELGNRELISLNPRYDPIPINDSIRCHGRVIGVLEPEWIGEM